MITVKHLAERLGISPALVYAWVESGALPCYRLGGRGKRGAIRVAEADLTAFLEGCRHEKERQAAKPAAPAKPPADGPAFKHLRVH
jgi:excisionase family DNA binding protein